MLETIMTWLLANWIEVIGVGTGAICVWFLAKDRAVLGWTFGIINAAFFIVLFWNNMIFAETALNSYYLITCIWGLYLWKIRGMVTARETVKITNLSKKGWVGSLLAVALMTIVGTWLLTFTPTDVAFLDALTTSLSLVGQFWIARKVYENWHFWIVADVFYVGLFIYKGLMLTAGLYAVFILICIQGLITWRKNQRLEQQAVGPQAAMHAEAVV